MKVETPQILWNSEGDKGINAALNSISLLESGLSDHAATNDNATDSRKYGNVMVTAGNTDVINLWKVLFSSLPSQQQQQSSSGRNNNTDKQSGATKIDYLCSLTRQEQSVNTVAFSPDGLHLATGGETGSIVVWSVPPCMRGNGNGRHYWSTVEREQDLNVRFISRGGEGICDISWSADSKRFIAGTIDHNVFVCEDKHYDANQRGGGGAPMVESDWQIVYSNSMDHSQFVQGVAYDPLGVYFASMGSDRTVRVFPRKTPPKSKKKVLRPTNAGGNHECVPPAEHQRMVDQLLTDSKLEVNKSKLIKFRRLPVSNNDNLAAASNAAGEAQSNNKPQRSHLYADESTLGSFFRRLCWTTDGAYLVTPAALWHANNSTADTNDKASPSFATYLFARHKFDEPCKVLSGLEKPSVVVRPNPVLFKLPGSDATMSSTVASESKENQTPSSTRKLPYRSIFAVLTTDTILVYDTHHTRPLSVIRGLHYAGLSDCQWSACGHQLTVSSTDGYITFVSFDNGELGEVYMSASPQRSLVHGSSSSPSTSSPLHLRENHCANPKNVLSCSNELKPKVESPRIPPCEPGQTATIEAPPSKRPKKTRITPTLISAPGCTTDGAANNKMDGNLPIPTPEHNEAKMAVATTTHAKRPADDILENETREAVTKLTLGHSEKPQKKKKRIAPVLVSTGN